MSEIAEMLSQPSADLLHSVERCQRKGFYEARWRFPKLRPVEMVTRVLYRCLGLTGREIDPFQAMIDLATEPGMATEQDDVYSQVVHYATLTDLLLAAIQKPEQEPWELPPVIDGWNASCLIAGANLRRILLVSNWNDERHYSECRNWFTQGEMAFYELPMQLIVFVIGQERNGRRHTPWTTAFQHPMNKQIRFRKRTRSTSEVFNDKWGKIYREEHAEITKETWLQAMLTDDVLPEVCFRVDVALPEKVHRHRIRDLFHQKMDRLYSLKRTPEASLSVCDWPVPCQFRKLCHSIPEREPSEKSGFIRISGSTLSPLVSSCTTS